MSREPKPARDPRGYIVDARGITVTAAGRERARRQLADLDEHWTPERHRLAREAFFARLRAL